MPNKTTTWQTERARIAGMSSRPNRPPDDPDLVEARRNMRALKLEADVLKVLAGQPPLSEEQRFRIAELLIAGGGAQ
ncbi:hypothetical protein A5790_01840 [Mycobacterium sp. 852002-51152_SCH6134967]|uniref:hypothetical protein n=1 Tax=Mycobacterium sp. 852002-51152_SCH6134967 TaxID=1834096 RepID=UPI0007FEB622|nr:hypothetical protein [Mycobacterium sp. 852002-51152_SCH6134967]OBF95110.1 hypothetical protein A5790_01840 [Mycobacterium sp. 852002-51152_SCH6134967]